VTLTLPLVGLVYQFVANRLDERNFLPPGQWTNVGGYMLHIHCTGSGSPTVILEGGLGGTSLDWALVQPELAATTRVCSYDRAGLGWSEADPAGRPRTSRQMAEELHTLLNTTGIFGPYVLVGLSAGGMHAQMFASQYPEAVVGMVLVDPTPAQLLMTFTQAERQALLPNLDQFRLLQRLEPFGLLRLIPLPAVAAQLPPKTQQTLRALNAQTGIASALYAEAAGFEASVAEVAALGPLPADRPLTVIWHGVPAEPLELEPVAEAAMRQLAGQADQGRFVIAAESGHYIPYDRPDVVIAEILALLGQ